MCKKETSSCHITNVMKILGGKWKLTILYRLMEGKMRFSALSGLIPTLSRKVLSDQLKQMEKDGLVIRKKYSQIPPKVEYSLTQHAIKLRPIIEFLSGWNKEISRID
jgi:DNA-binding HxlR family transcriptional regulator